jgi:hypothetical protein
MGRVRYSRAEAEAEVARRAKLFVHEQSYSDNFVFRLAFPDPLAKPSRASKHPVAWLAVFSPIPPEGGCFDGGELFVGVNLETDSVGFSDFV